MQNQEFELLLYDRLEVIKTMNKKYDLENNSYISFSGGKDSTILHYLIDMALPNNKIPRVFINTGIEYVDIVKFVKDLANQDERFTLIPPSLPIRQVLEKYGYPFKSKQHSHNLDIYRNNKEQVDKYIKEIENNKELLKDYNYIHNLPKGVKTLIKYIYGIRENNIYIYISTKIVPNCLRYQFIDDFKIHCSDKCCYKMKKEPVAKWQKESGKSITITGMRKEEGGNRDKITCIVTDKDKKVVKFHPLSVVSEEWEDWFIKKYNIDICKLYLPPYNFKRTGCKGCPFSLELQQQLDTMEKYLPNEKKQCEMIWKPVYDEYRRIGFRLKKQKQMNIFDFMEENNDKSK